MYKNIINNYKKIIDKNDAQIKDIEHKEIDYLKDRVLNEHDKSIFSRLGWNTENLIIDAIKDSIYCFSVLYNNVPLFVAGVFQNGYNNKDMIWLMPDKNSSYKCKLTRICKQLVKEAAKLHKNIYAMDLKECPQDIKWLEILGGDKIDEVFYNNAVFCVIEFKGA